MTLPLKLCALAAGMLAGAASFGQQPGTLAAQRDAVEDINDAVLAQQKAVADARTALNNAQFAPKRDPADIRAKVEALAAAELALASARATEFTKLQASPNRLSVQQTETLVTAAGRGASYLRLERAGSLGFSPLDDLEEFLPIFDGKTLAGWDGDPLFWRVEQGVIVGESTPQKVVTEGTSLIWRAGKLRDFELKFHFRFVGAGALSTLPIKLRGRMSGPSMKTGDDRPWGVAARPFNLDAQGSLFGGLVVRMSRTSSVVGTVGTVDPLNFVEWNSVHIIAHGTQFTILVNGRLAGMLIDESTTFDPEGLLAFELPKGPPSRIEFRNIFLKDDAAATKPGQAWPAAGNTPR